MLFKDCKLPRYLPKDGYTTLVIGFVGLNGNKLVLPFSNSFKRTHKPVEITIPPVLLDKKLRKSVLYLRLTQGSLKFSTYTKLNAFKEILIKITHLL